MVHFRGASQRGGVSRGSGPTPLGLTQLVAESSPFDEAPACCRGELGTLEKNTHGTENR